MAWLSASIVLDDHTTTRPPPLLSTQTFLGLAVLKA